MSHATPSRGANSVRRRYSRDEKFVDPGVRVPVEPLLTNGSSNPPPEPMIRWAVARTPALITTCGTTDQVACTKPLASLVSVGPGKGFRRLRVARKFVDDR